MKFTDISPIKDNDVQKQTENQLETGLRSVVINVDGGRIGSWAAMRGIVGLAMCHKYCHKLGP